LSAGESRSVKKPAGGGRVGTLPPEPACHPPCPVGTVGRFLKTGRVGADTYRTVVCLYSGKPSHGPDNGWKTSAQQRLGGRRARRGRRLGRRLSAGRSSVTGGSPHRLQHPARRQPRSAVSARLAGPAA